MEIRKTLILAFNHNLIFPPPPSSLFRKWFFMFGEKYLCVTGWEWLMRRLSGPLSSWNHISHPWPLTLKTFVPSTTRFYRHTALQQVSLYRTPSGPHPIIMPIIIKNFLIFQGHFGPLCNLRVWVFFVPCPTFEKTIFCPLKEKIIK